MSELNYCQLCKHHLFRDNMADHACAHGLAARFAVAKVKGDYENGRWGWARQCDAFEKGPGAIQAKGDRDEKRLNCAHVPFTGIRR